MWRTKWWLACVGGILIAGSGCSSPKQPAIAERIGPAPAVSIPHQDAGYLAVYSAWSNFVDQGSTGHHSRYIVSADDGRSTREIINHVDRFDEGPIQLPLAPGAYHVRARSAHFGRVNIPIVIEPHRTTLVYLDGRPHPETRGEQASTEVKLPDGEVVGYSATVSNPR